MGSVNEGIPFLGFVVYPERRRLKRRKVVYYRRRLRALVDGYHAGDIAYEAIEASAEGWVGHARYGNTVGLRKAVLGSLLRGEDLSIF